MNCIERNEKNWQVIVGNGDTKRVFEAKKLILALPPRMIVKHLTPENWASETLRASLASVPTWMAAQAKFLASYKTAFWREDGLSGQVFSQKGPLQEMHDASGNLTKTNALFGFIGVPATHRSRYSEESIRNACLSQLSELYGDQALETSSVLIKDWSTDRYIASDIDLSEAPSHPQFDLKFHQQELNKKKLFLVGSEFSTFDAGYLEGAVRAVAENLDAGNECED